jgi:glycosyltransferase involved in cell wall biosynthesis
VIVPTYQRRELVCALVESLARQRLDAFEVVVVVDGSTDGTVEALSAMKTTFPLRVLFHPNQGLARTRNRGAAVAAGEILLFLDDDMEPDPDLLAEHDRHYGAGADAVAGSIPLHPDSVPTLLADGVGVWAEKLARRCSQPGHALRYFEVSCGHLSIRRAVFDRLGGFDERFTAQGSYGNEDRDFAHRLLAGGFRVAFSATAVARQCYVVDAAAHLRQYRQAGRADVVLARKYPKLSPEIFHGELAESDLHRWLRRPVLLAPRLAGWAAAPLRRIAVVRCDRGKRDWFTQRAFFCARAVEYWRGVAEADGAGIVGRRPRARSPAAGRTAAGDVGRG